MAGKASAGFTKSAQKEKFVRNRDIKLKNSEVKKEANIQKAMCEGICTRCREKAQWRFRYDKYKPLRAPATCQDCRGKTVTKAYRTLCDKCASKKKACPSCCMLLELDVARAQAIAEAAEASTTELTSTMEIESSGNLATKSTSAVHKESATGGDEGVLIGGVEHEDEGEMNEDVEGEEEEEVEDTEQTSSAAAAIETQPKSAVDLASAWDERKFTNMAALKYGKHRVVGASDDTVFNFCPKTDEPGST